MLPKGKEGTANPGTKNEADGGRNAGPAPGS
ncbi:hypothetical protein SSPIM334S_06906 [Streptomyces spiroverticillatus]